MTWINNFFVNINDTTYQLTVSASMYANEWVFKVDNVTHTDENQKLLPHTIYLRFDRDKKYLSCFPSKAVTHPVANIIATELKKYEDKWIRSINP